MLDPLSQKSSAVSLPRQARKVKCHRNSVYYDTNSKQYVLANRGTVNTNDWNTNFAQGTGLPADQYTQAIKVAQQIAEAVPGQVSFTGHSLGGGMAIAQALVTVNEATVFNAAAVHENTLAPNHVDFAKAPSLVHAYNVSGEVLNFVQDGGKYGLAALAIASGGVLGDVAAVKLAGMPDVVGDRYALTAVQPPSQDRGRFTWGQNMGWTDKVTNMVKLHYMSSMIYSLTSSLYSGQWQR